MAKVASQQIQQVRKPVKGLFRTFREVSSSLGELTLNGVDSMIFEQRKTLLKERLLGDTIFLKDLQEDAKSYGGINACKAAHNELVALLEELQL